MTGIETHENLAVRSDLLLPSPDIAMWTVERLGAIADGLTGAGIESWVTGGREVLSFQVPFRGDLDLGKSPIREVEEAYREHEKQGGISTIGIRRDPESGRVVFAQIEGDFPATVGARKSRGSFTQDQWVARFQLPTPEGEVPTVVLDSWKLPLTALTRLLIEGCSGDSDEYQRLSVNLFHKKDSGAIPVGARNVYHSVYGRKGDLVDAREFDGLADLLDVTFDGAQEVIAQKQIRAGKI